TTAADIYSLGAILYELLTGQPPFRCESVAQTLRMVEEREPTPPTRINPTADRDLEAVALKCLEKDPARRYETAGGLADDLAHWLRGEPVIARRAGTARRMWKWVKRNPVVTALGTAVVLALVAGSVTSAVYATRANRRAKEAAENELAARHQERIVRNREEVLMDVLCLTKYQQASAVRLAGRPGWRGQALTLLESAAELRTRPRDAANPDDQTVELPDLADIRGEAVMALMRPDVTLVHELPGVGDSPKLSMDGSRLLDVSLQAEGKSPHSTYLVHDLVAGKDLARHVFSLTNSDPAKPDISSYSFLHAALNQDGTRVTSSSVSGIQLYELPSLKQAGRLTHPGPHPKSEFEFIQTRCCFSPDGSRLLAKRPVGKEARFLLWELDKPNRPTEIFRRPTETGEGGSWFGLFSPDGKWVAHPAAGGNSVRVLDITRDPPVEVTTVPAHRSREVCWHPSGSILAILSEVEGGSTFHLALWDVKTGVELVRAKEEFDGGLSLAFNPNGEFLAVASGRGCHVLGGRDLVERFRINQFGFEYWGRVAWTPNGELITAVNSDSIRVWRIAQDIPARALYRTGGFTSTDYTRDGRWLAGVHVGLQTTRSTERQDKPRGLWELIRDSIDKSATRIVIVDRRTGEVIRSLRAESQLPIGMQYSPDGSRLAYYDFKAIAIWDWAAGKQVIRQPHDKMKFGIPTGIKWVADGRLLAFSTVLLESRVLLWDVETGNAVLSKSDLGENDPETVINPHLSRDGRWLVAEVFPHLLPKDDDVSPRYRVFDLRDRKTVAEFSLREGERRYVPFGPISPDGRRFVTETFPNESEPGKARVWGELQLRSLQDGSVVARVPAQRAEIDSERTPFSSDGKYVLLHGEAGQALLLDADTGQVLIRWRPAGERGPGLLRFTPDGWIAAGGLDDETMTFLNLEEVRKRLTEIGLGW
ncbi:MAG TPA: hypothetical protein VKE40_16060, partial [Gemmataceae bacterium]|nr:hypothetical protein [Gemmataceae bacterium]